MGGNVKASHVDRNSLSVGRSISNLPLCVNDIFSSGCCGLFVSSE